MKRDEKKEVENGDLVSAENEMLRRKNDVELI